MMFELKKSFFWFLVPFLYSVFNFGGNLIQLAGMPTAAGAGQFLTIGGHQQVATAPAAQQTSPGTTVGPTSPGNVVMVRLPCWLLLSQNSLLNSGIEVSILCFLKFELRNIKRQSFFLLRPFRVRLVRSLWAPFPIHCRSSWFGTN